MQSDKPTHVGFVCDGCRDSGKFKFQPHTSPIIGIRYKCLSCAGMIDFYMYLDRGPVRSADRSLSLVRNRLWHTHVPCGIDYDLCSECEQRLAHYVALPPHAIGGPPHDYRAHNLLVLRTPGLLDGPAWNKYWQEHTRPPF